MITDAPTSRSNHSIRAGSRLRLRRHTGTGRTLALAVTGAFTAAALAVALPNSAQAVPAFEVTTNAQGIDVSYQDCDVAPNSPGTYNEGWKGLAFGGGVGPRTHGAFMALRSDGRVFRSLDDGSSWSQAGKLKLLPESTSGVCIYRNGWISYGEPSGVPTWVIALKAENSIFTSTDDGETWSPRISVPGEPLKLAYGGGRFLLGQNGQPYSALTSTDGLNWTNGAAFPGDGGGYPGGSTYGNGQFVIPIGQSSDVCTSASGTSFSCTTDAFLDDGGNRQWQDMAFGSGVFVGAIENPESGNNGLQLQRSVDAAVWQAPTTGPASRVSGLAYGDGYFVAEGFGTSRLDGWNATGTTVNAYFSSDGLTWIDAGAGSAGKTFIAEYGNRLAYGDHHFVGVGNNGVTTVGVLSGVSPDPSSSPTSEPVPSPINESPVITPTSSPTPSPTPTQTVVPVTEQSTAPTFSPSPSAPTPAGVVLLAGTERANAQVVVVQAPVSTSPVNAPEISVSAGAAVAPVVSGLPASTSLEAGMSVSPLTRAKVTFASIGKTRSTANGRAKVPAFKASRAGVYTIQLMTPAHKAFYLKVKVAKRAAAKH